ncbi:hypothetical protein HMPREF1586_01144 [Gardnerella vaginalis JCP8522]|nr:hypothetical protein HMPREF1586_01144 [Gardnerella vaginalis JCP8522]
MLSFCETRAKMLDFNNLSVLDSSFVKRKVASRKAGCQEFEYID